MPFVVEVVSQVHEWWRINYSSRYEYDAFQFSVFFAKKSFMNVFFFIFLFGNRIKCGKNKLSYEYFEKPFGVCGL